MTEVDLILLAIGCYVAVTSLVRLMRGCEIEFLLDLQRQVERQQQHGGQ